MKNTIYYFSGTGNSLKIAQDLAEKLGDTNVVAISNIMKKGSDLSLCSDKIGIIYPVYAWGIPKIVSKFIRKVKVANKDAYFFAIATCGGRVAGSLLQLSKELSSRDFKLSLGVAIPLPTNYTVKFGACSIDKQNTLFKAAEEKLNKIALQIKNNQVEEIERGSLKDCVINTGVISRLFSLFVHNIDRGFWTNNDCVSCGLCKKICPAQSIELKNGKPVWLHQCEQCFRCLNYCPKDAIQFSKKTVGKKRYKNLFIPLNDLIKNEMKDE